MDGQPVYRMTENIPVDPGRMFRSILATSFLILFEHVQFGTLSLKRLGTIHGKKLAIMMKFDEKKSALYS
jgi:hypothetical protein